MRKINGFFAMEMRILIYMNLKELSTHAKIIKEDEKIDRVYNLTKKVKN